MKIAGTVHQASWSLADAGMDSKLYQCTVDRCTIQRQVRRDVGFPPPEVHHGALPGEPTRSAWPLPHMEHVPGQPTPTDLRAELEKVADELGNAIYMHRQAWIKAREYADWMASEYDRRHPEALPGDRGRAAELAALRETDRTYTRKIGDVKFWLAEREAHAATVSALAALINLREGLPLAQGGPVSSPLRFPRQR